MTSLKPHGGVLINRELTGQAREEAKTRAKRLPVLTLSERELCDLEMITTGAMSPLEGFMVSSEYESVLEKKRLSNKLPWTIPVTKSISADEKIKVSKESQVVLQDSKGRQLAILEVAGIQNILTKSIRRDNPHNVVRATLEGLRELRHFTDIAKARGKTVGEIL